MGPDQDLDYRAGYTTLAFNPVLNEYLVVWRGDDNSGELMRGEYEVLGQRLDTDGNEIGDGDFRLSDMGPNGSDRYKVEQPAVAANINGDEYLVVWYGDYNNDGLVDGEDEIFGQRYQVPTSFAVYLPIIYHD